MMTPMAAARTKIIRVGIHGCKRYSMLWFCLLALLVRGSTALVPASDQQTAQRLWQIFDQPDRARAWKAVFGENGERGEYMDGYSESAMFDRCDEDYKWTKKFPPEAFLSERAKMVRAPSTETRPCLEISAVASHFAHSPVRRCRTSLMTSACGSMLAWWGLPSTTS